jgi:O-antigen/teichoic acid export membrane protein
MTMTGNQDTAAWILALHAVLNLALNVILIPRFGIEGAAVATALTRVSWNVVMALVAWRRLRLRATIL